MTVELKPSYALTREVPGITVPVYLSRRGRDIVVGHQDGRDMTYYVVTTAPSIAVTRRTWPGIISVRDFHHTPDVWTVVNIAALIEGTS